VGVLGDGQYDAIALLRRLSVMMIILAVLLAVGVLVRMDVSGMMLSRRGKLLEEMVYPMRRGRGEKKPQRGGDAQV